MKRIAILAALLLMTITSFAQSIYQKYSDAENVSAVYVSPAMFRLIGKLPEISADTEDGKVDLTPVISTLTGMYVIDSHNQTINSALASEVQKFIASGKYELLMEAKDNGQTMRMYTLGDEKVVNSFVMLALENGETTFICIDGKMNRKDLEKVLAEQMK